VVIIIQQMERMVVVVCDARIGVSFTASVWGQFSQVQRLGCLFEMLNRRLMTTRIR